VSRITVISIGWRFEGDAMENKQMVDEIDERGVVAGVAVAILLVISFAAIISIYAGLL
jgi:hypothetical protein